jgi:hypothetical protein
MREQATKAQRKALLRLPLPASEIRKDDRNSRRMMWVRIVARGWAKWDEVPAGITPYLRRTPRGDLALCTTQQAYENEYSSQMEEYAQETGPDPSWLPLT